ncbi:MULTISPECIES: sigma 54-interacting transcriptional regulator [unclassified Coleofasciculus]|uniref:sigma 54-interacting transcriptional regulator n=1 Tax=unclassified Coleofasciculus TaxID=2692782 RepID=UPI001880B0C6|nr:MULTISPECIES: sigma 54-interacting transcriptional regulator [unclassified Coleofasciculus]MBE9125985.1 sigma 54-interacting transcriptional regulator [Coleofasciculus sp. LEGE 07081]MBE9151179.1 sigma 54-interacting transcriptional regulator [Coleofasciculus sp. LEGE 07092]
MTFPDWVTWLRERTAFSILSEDVLNAIAQVMEERIVPANQRLVLEDTPVESLYILQQGRIEGDRTSQIGSLWGVSWLPGAVIHLQEILLNQPAQRTIVTLTDCHLLTVPVERFQELVQQYPEISQAFSPQLAQDLAKLSSELSYEQERQTALRPYLVSKAKRGIIGRTRYAVRLRQQIKKATEDRKSVMIFGEPGLEKDNTATLIHFGSPSRREPIIKIDCSTVQASGAELLGREGGKPGLIESLTTGTLILNNVDELPPELMPQLATLLETGTYLPVSRSEAQPAEPKLCSARVIMISEKALPTIKPLVGHFIKVPPLRVRKGDLGDQMNYYISLLCRAKGINKPKVTPEALRQLQAYDFPGNLRELQNLVERAIVQSDCAKELTEELVWPSQSKKKQFRFNLLNAYPQLRRFLRSDWWPDRINYGFTLSFFTLVVIVGFIGPQNRQENFTLNMFWAWWWPLVLISFPFVGRLWCAVCPFMIYGEVTQKLSLWLFPRQLKPWPRQLAEQWGGWFLFGLFVLIFLWEELWDLENTAYLSACLLLLITAGAMICSAIFERRFWCRYLCPIGGMNGLFAKLSMTELRAQQGTCSAECTTYQCYKGGPQKGEGMETNGCPLYSHPAQLQDNRDCVLCMTCLKACPHRSVEFNLRPPGIELWTTHSPRSYEVALLLLLLGGVFLHRLPELNEQLNLQLDLTQFWTHFGFSLTALSLPAAIPLLAYGGMQLVHRLIHNPKPRPFVQLAYGFLPLVLAGNLAHYLRLGLTEGGRILPVTFATFGLSGEGLPVLVAHPAVIAFLQGVTLIAGALLTVVLTQKIAGQSVRSLVLQHFAAVVLGVSLWVIIVG